MFSTMRKLFDKRGLSPFDIHLEGEPEDVALLEGGLRVRSVGDEFVLETVDYGRGYPLIRAAGPDDIIDLTLDYIDRPLPVERGISRNDLDELVAPIAHHYFDVRDRAAAAGEAGIVLDLPAGLPLDRIGALDGVHLYPIDTPFELRSLPPHVLRPESDVVQFVTTEPLRVGAVITPAWFGRSGGGLRFTLQEPMTGIRDVVARGTLERVRVTA